MRSQIVILGASVIFAACGKELNTDTSLIPQGTYHTGTSVTVSPPVMYVQNRQITDSAVINLFLRMHNLQTKFSYDAVETTTDTLLTIKIMADDSVSVKTYHLPFYYPGKKECTGSSEICITRFDSIMIYLPQFPEPVTRCGTITSMLFKYPDLFRYHIRNGTGTAEGFKALTPRFPLLYYNNKLVLPMMSYAYSSVYGNNSNCAGYYGGRWDIKSTALIENQLAFSDTLVLQEKRIVLQGE